MRDASLPAIALGMAAGAMLACCAPGQATLGMAFALLAAAAALVAVLALARRLGLAGGVRLGGLGAFVLAALIGAGWAGLRLGRIGPDDLVHSAPARHARVVARVATDPVRTADTWRFEAIPLAVHSSVPRRAGGRIIVGWKTDRGRMKTRASPDLEPAGSVTWPRYGDLVMITGSVRAIAAPTNPGQPEYAAWAARRGIFARMRAQRVDVVGLASAAFDPVRLATDLKHRAAGIVARHLAPADASLVGSLLFGVGAVPVDPETRTVFTDLGLAHILAVSGMQVTLLVGLACAAGRAAGLPRVVRCLLAAALAALYAAMCGFAPSVLRAAWMSAAALLADLTDRQATGRRALWLSAFVLLVLDPVLVADLGFQFSFLATWGLLTTGSRLSIGLGRALGIDRIAVRTPLAAASAFGVPTRPGHRIAAAVLDGLAVPIAALIWCLPLQLAHFGQVSAWSLVANWYAEILVVILTYAGFCTAALGLVAEPIAGWVSWMLGPTSAALRGGLACLHGLPGATVRFPPPPLWVAGAAYMALVAGQRAGACRDEPSPGSGQLDDGAAAVCALPDMPRPGVAGRILALPATIGILVVGAAGAGAPPGGLDVTVLDVGQGDAIVVRGPHGSCALVDAGPASANWDAGAAIGVPGLTRLGCRSLDLAVVTHDHRDHAGGMPAILRSLPVREFWDGGQAGTGAAQNELLAQVLTAGIPLITAGAGHRRVLDGVAWDVLAPMRPFVHGSRSDANNNAVVIRLTYRGVRILLAADLEAETERRLLAWVAPGELRADVLKAPHHGSRYGATAPWLDAVRPRASVVSVGRDNPFDHPDAATIARLRAYGPVYRTDRDGAVSLRVREASWSLTSFLP